MSDPAQQLRVLILSMAFEKGPSGLKQGLAEETMRFSQIGEHQEAWLQSHPGLQEPWEAFRLG